ncbi:MAG: metallophosphoesterase [Victivallaceae bacterium]|nr:metallophosphoesterase [Victivallaceae bacterium]
MKTHAHRLLLLFSLCFAWTLPAGRAVIVCTADLHGEGETFARLATEIRRRDPDVLIDAGDLFSGNFTAVSDGGATMFRALDALSYDVFVPGNHDFDGGPDALGKSSAQFHGQLLGHWRTPALPSVKSWIVLERKSLRIGIIGLGNPEEKSRILPGVDFLQPSYDEALEESLRAVKSAGANLTVLVCHRGLYHKEGALADLLRRHPGVDLVFGSHSHQPVRGLALAGSFYVQPGARAESAACAVVTFDDRNKTVTQIESLLLAPGTESDLALSRLFAEAEKRIAGFGDAPAAGYDEAIALPLPGRFDCDFARLAAEALREAVGSDVAVFDGYAAERKIFPPITRRKLFALDPYNGRIIVAQMTREELEALMKEMLGAVPPRRAGVVPGFAGISYRTKGKQLVALDVPETVTAALGAFRFCRSTALTDLRADRRRWRDSGVLEQDAIWEKIVKEGKK